MFSLCMIKAWSIQNHCNPKPTKHAKATIAKRILGRAFGGGLPTRTSNRGKLARKYRNCPAWIAVPTIRNAGYAHSHALVSGPQLRARADLELPVRVRLLR